MAQRLVRAKRKIRASGIPFRVPPPEVLRDRLADVLHVVYLMFTEGHRASAGRSLVREDLCLAAVGLARRLRELIDDQPVLDALLALLLLTDARRPARTDSSGRTVLLGEQDRRLWDHQKIREGLDVLEEALVQRRPGPYQLQAAIAACHASAADFASTDWHQICALYERLCSQDPSPVGRGQPGGGRRHDRGSRGWSRPCSISLPGSRRSNARGRCTSPGVNSSAGSAEPLTQPEPTAAPGRWKCQNQKDDSSTSASTETHRSTTDIGSRVAS
jgi:hypothetical protein